MFISLPNILDLSNKNIRLELAKLLARFYPQIQFRFVFKNALSLNFFSVLKTVFLVAYKAV